MSAYWHSDIRYVEFLVFVGKLVVGRVDKLAVAPPVQPLLGPASGQLLAGKVACSCFTLPVSYSELLNAGNRRESFTDHFSVMEWAAIMPVDQRVINP